MFLQLRRDIVVQAQARVVHGPQQALDLQLRVQPGGDALDVIHKVAETFQCVVLALHGDDHAIGSDQGVEGQHRQRRWAVDEDEVVVLADRRQGVAQAALLDLHFQQHHFGGGQVTVGRQQLETTVLGVMHGLGQVAFPDQQVVDRVLELVLVHTAAHGGVALRIEVDQQHTTLGRGQRGGEIDTGGGLAHTTFLVRDCEYLSH
ncbi:hypothetical protein D3C77_506790 [compost metagenome]